MANPVSKLKQLLIAHAVYVNVVTQAPKCSVAIAKSPTKAEDGRWARPAEAIARNDGRCYRHCILLVPKRGSKQAPPTVTVAILRDNGIIAVPGLCRGCTVLFRVNT